MMRIRQIFISPAHVFVGHHGREPGKEPMVAMDAVKCIAGRGIEGDRYFNHQPDYKGQITFFDARVFDRMKRELGLPEGASIDGTRRNVIVEGKDLASLVGREFELQGVRFQGVEECRPCYWMNRAFRHESAESWLQGHGGLRARILSDGELRVDGAA